MLAGSFRDQVCILTWRPQPLTALKATHLAHAVLAGSFRDKVRTGELERMNISEQITVRQDAAQAQSHTAGFEVG